MQRARNNSRKTVHNSVHESVEGIRDHAAGMGESVRDFGESIKDLLIDKFTDMLKQAVSLGNKGKTVVRDAAIDAKDDLEEKIQESPYRSLLIAAGVGLMLGLVIRRR
jgi:ElaB/YqjD/DUF883 family membrane-anchored ribosome-binding protein